MPEPAEGTRLLDLSTPATPVTSSGLHRRGASNSVDEVEGGYQALPAHHYPHHNYDPSIYPHKVDVNAMKRNMSIAKGFMDISLLTANASQLKHLLLNGDQSTSAYKILLTGLLLSITLQILTGVLLIMKERFDLNQEDHQNSADRYNNLTLIFVFITLLLNVFIGSFGVSIPQPRGNGGPFYDQEIKGKGAIAGPPSDPFPQTSTTQSSILF